MCSCVCRLSDGHRHGHRQQQQHRAAKVQPAEELCRQSGRHVEGWSNRTTCGPDTSQVRQYWSTLTLIYKHHIREWLGLRVVKTLWVFTNTNVYIVNMYSVCACVCSDSPKTEFLLTNYTQPKELLFAIKELAYLGGDTNTGETHTFHTATLHWASTLIQTGSQITSV